MDEPPAQRAADQVEASPAEPPEDAAPAPSSWRERAEKNALWVSLGAIALAGAIVAVGVQVAPERFYDRFWWEDIWGPLVVDAHQCKTDLGCPGVTAPGGVRAKDGYTITSELTYGAVLATMLYGIYVGLFRRFRIVADGRFVLALLPWIMLGPLARVLEDADVFCRAGTHCDPGPFAFVFISPVIYIHIAVYVIAGMLIGVFLQRRAASWSPGKLTGVVGALLGAGFAAYLYVALVHAEWFSALPPVWFVALTVLGAAAFFHARARRGFATMNATVFALGLPFALGCIWLVLDWLGGHVWSEAAWSGAFYREAGAFILAVGLAMAAIVFLLARFMVKSGAEARWAALASRVPQGLDRKLGWAGVAALVFALLTAGVLPNLQPFFEDVPSKELVIPATALGGLVLLVVFAFLQVGRGVAARPGTLLLFAAGINVALVFGHVIDGVATWVALEDPLGFGLPQYSEKHPFSEFLLRYWGGFLFPATKLAMVLIVAWVLDHEVKEDKPDEKNLVGLVKMAIFVLGFAPGLRDTLRLAMGV